MEYIKKYCSEEEYSNICSNLTVEDCSEFTLFSNRVESIIKYLLSIGIKNIADLLLYRSSLFYEDVQDIEASFQNCKIDNIVEYINEDIVGFELLGL